MNLSDLKKSLLEAFDDENVKANLSPEDYKNMAYPQDYVNKYQQGLYKGEGMNTKVNSGISKWMYYPHDVYGIADNLYSIVISKIPEFKGYKLETDEIDNYRGNFNLSKELDIPNEPRHAAKINLWVTFYFKGDRLMGRKKNGINILFTPSITPKAKSVDLGGYTNIDTLQADLYGSPDKEDEDIADKFRIHVQVMSLNKFSAVMDKVNSNLQSFKHYIHYKYDL